jgi:hypothetical protein
MFRQMVIGACILLFSSIAMAEPHKSKSWVWDVNTKGYYYAATIKSTGQLLGQYCDFSADECNYMVSFKIPCEEGQESPALINSNVGAAQVTLICDHKYNNNSMFTVSPFDEVDKIVRDAGRAGFAIPIGGGRYEIVIFSLYGSSFAIDSMRSAADKKMN